jgi:hypothetical protein
MGVNLSSMVVFDRNMGMATKLRKQKKKKKREKAVKKRKILSKNREVYESKYPIIKMDVKYADIELTNHLRSIFSGWDFRKTHPMVRDFFSDIKCMPDFVMEEKYGDVVMETILKNSRFEETDDDYVESVKSKIKSNQVYQYAENMILYMIFDELKKNGMWDKFMPNHCVFVYIHYGDIYVLVDSFRAHHSRFGNGYYHSQNPMKVSIDGKDYVVALSSHAVDRLCERFGSKNTPYYPINMNLMLTNSKVTYTQLINGADGLQIEIPYTSQCQDSIMSFAHKMAYELCGEIPKKFWYLAGYSPFGYCDDEFIHLKTFLEPGMNGTPENNLLMSLREPEKIRFKDQLRKSNLTDEYVEMRKFFHDNGCYQVRSFDGND